MKVVYNACYGGFGLSPLAEDAYAKRKDIELFWYSSEGFSPKKYTRLSEVPLKPSFNNQAFTADLGESATEYPEGSFYYPSYDRADLDLIAVIEGLGDAANGSHAELAIEEIPDGSEYEITEYDGFEGVEPPRQSW